jgi:hypothetical protein
MALATGDRRVLICVQVRRSVQAYGGSETPLRDWLLLSAW